MTSKMTLDQLAVIVRKGFEKGSEDLENLAIMVQKGFEDVENQMAKKSDLFAMREELLGEIGATRNEVSAAREDLFSLSKRVDRLEQRMEYGFEMVSKELKEIRAQLKELDVRTDNDIFQLRSRVDKIERRMKTR